MRACSGKYESVTNGSAIHVELTINTSQFLTEYDRENLRVQTKKNLITAGYPLKAVIVMEFTLDILILDFDLAKEKIFLTHIADEYNVSVKSARSHE